MSLDKRYKYLYNRDIVKELVSAKTLQFAQNCKQGLTAETNYYTIETSQQTMQSTSVVKIQQKKIPKVVDIDKERIYNRGIRCKKRMQQILRKLEIQMKAVTIHYCFDRQAKQAGFMPTSWLLSSNDRTPEICQGSREDRVA